MPSTEPDETTPSHRRRSRRGTPAWALVLALGIAGAGFLIGRSADRYITVKGLAESFAAADLAVWPLRITATGNDLARVQDRIGADLAAMTRFLTGRGIEPEEIRSQRVEVTDLLAQGYRPEGLAARTASSLPSR